MEIKLDADAVASIASAAIFDSLSQEARESVIKQAIEYLLVPDKDRSSYGTYGAGKTPLQTAFEQAIQKAAFKAVDEKVKDDPRVQEHIDKLLGPLVTATLDAEAKDYDSSLADAIGGALGMWLAEAARIRNSR